MPETSRVLVTRAWPGSEDTAARLSEEGYTPIVSPALEIEPLPNQLPDLGGVSGLVFTSANGVRAFSARSDRRDFVAWCVGSATAAEACEAGFGDVRNADGDADDLAAFIAGHADFAGGSLLHVANDAAAGNLVQSLRKSGFNARFAPLYTTRPAKTLSQSAKKALDSGELGAVLIHSAKGAAGFYGLAREADLSDVFLVAISDRAAAPVQSLAWRGCIIATAPNEEALIKALRMCYRPD